MDPLLVFPPEIIHQIWSSLSPQELLPVRAVASHWLSSVTSSPGAWVTEFSNDWHEYLEVKKIVRRWNSKCVRQETFKNVRECVFTQSAYYLLHNDGTLTMYNPCGKPVREFDTKIRHLYRGLGGLVLVPVQQENVVFVTDAVMNIIDVLHEVELIDAFEYGLACSHKNQRFLEINQRRISCELKAPTPHIIHPPANQKCCLLKNCFVQIDGLIDKVVKYNNLKGDQGEILNSFKASPMVIPYVSVQPGPDNFYSVIAELGSFIKIIVYSKNVPLLLEIISRENPYFFTQDFFVLVKSSVATVYNLKDFNDVWTYKIDRIFSRVLNSSPLSHLRNSFVAYEDTFAKNILFYQIRSDQEAITMLGVQDDVVLNGAMGCFPEYAFSANSDGSVNVHYFLL